MKTHFTSLDRSRERERLVVQPLAHARGYRFFETALASLAGVPLLTGCSFLAGPPAPKPEPAVLSTGALLPSPRLIVGRVIAVDEAQRLAFVELASDAPKGALVEGTELFVRTLALQDKGRVQASAYVRGRTLGTKIMAGQPSPGDEVVWLAP